MISIRVDKVIRGGGSVCSSVHKNVYRGTGREMLRGNELPNLTFQRGDFFHHPEMGLDEALEVIRVGRGNLKGSNAYPYDKEDCIWIPTATQLVKELSGINFIFSIEVAKRHYESQNHILAGLSDEEMVLAYYMEFHDNKEWNFENESWDLIEEGP